MCLEIFGPGFGADRRQANFVESGGNCRAGRLKAEPLAPEPPVAASAEANHRARTVVLVLESHVADDLSRFGRQHPWAFLGLSIGAGFLVGRLARTTAAVVNDGQQGPAQLPTSRVAAIDGPQTASAMSYSDNGPSTADGGQ